MANSFVQYPGDGTNGPYPITFDFDSSSEISVYITGTLDPTATRVGNNIYTTSPAATSADVTIIRKTPRDPLSPYVDGSALTQDILNDRYNQMLWSAQEDYESDPSHYVERASGIPTGAPAIPLAPGSLTIGSFTPAPVGGWYNYRVQLPFFIPASQPTDDCTMQMIFFYNGAGVLIDYSHLSVENHSTTALQRGSIHHEWLRIYMKAGDTSYIAINRASGTVSQPQLMNNFIFTNPNVTRHLVGLPGVF